MRASTDRPLPRRAVDVGHPTLFEVVPPSPAGRHLLPLDAWDALDGGAHGRRPDLSPLFLSVLDMAATGLVVLAADGAELGRVRSGLAEVAGDAWRAAARAPDAAVAAAFDGHPVRVDGRQVVIRQDLEPDLQTLVRIRQEAQVGLLLLRTRLDVWVRQSGRLPAPIAVVVAGGAIPCPPFSIGPSAICPVAVWADRALSAAAVLSGSSAPGAGLDHLRAAGAVPQAAWGQD